MDLSQLNTDLQVLGNVTTLEEVDGELRVSIYVGIIDDDLINNYHSIILNQVIGDYPNIDVEAFEGGSIKAIYNT